MDIKLEENLIKTRKKIFMSISQDGIADMAAGVIFLFLALQMYTDNPIFIFFYFLPALFTKRLKEKITFPRIGFVNISRFTQDRPKNPVFLYMAISLVILGIVVGTMQTLGLTFPAIVTKFALIVAGLMTALAMVMVSLYTGIRRISYYAFFLMLIFIHAHLMEFPVTEGKEPIRQAIGIYISVFALILIITGTIYLVKFLRDNPVVDIEMEEDTADTGENNEK